MKNLKTDSTLEESSPRGLAAMRQRRVKTSSDTLQSTDLPVCAFKFCYAKKVENYAEKLMEELNNGRQS